MHSGTEFIERHIDCPIYMTGRMFPRAADVQDEGIGILDLFPLS